MKIKLFKIMYLIILYVCKFKFFYLTLRRQIKYLLNVYRFLKLNNFFEIVIIFVNTRYLKEMLDVRIIRICINNINLFF